MDQRDNRYNNKMGPRLDLGLRPPRQGQAVEQPPYRRQPLSPYRQESQGQAEAPRYQGASEPLLSDPYQPYGVEPAQSGGEEEYGPMSSGGAYAPPNEALAYVGEGGQSYHSPSAAPMFTPKPGFSRWLVWLALALSLLALLISVTGRMSGSGHESAAQSGEAVPGATAERVAKLEKDVSSLLLKMVTLETELEAVKNRAWNPAVLSELNNKLSALQNQVKSLEAKLAGARASTPPAASPAPTASPAPAASAPEAAPHVQARAGDKPEPLATRIGGAGVPAAASPVPPSGNPRHSYTVQRGDTLFSIAQRYQVTTKDLLKWNNMGPDDVLKVGKTLVIY